MIGNLILLHSSEISFQFTIEETETLLTEIEILTKMLLLQIQLYIRKNIEWKEIPIKFDIGTAIYKWKIIREEKIDPGTKIRRGRKIEKTLERKTKEITEEITIKETTSSVFQKEFLFIVLTEGLNK